MNHSRSPQPLICSSEPVRPTWPRSAAKTPSWQVSEDSTRIVVLTGANGTFSSSVFSAQRSGLTAADREVRREERREEHQLAREPDDRPDTDHAGSVVVPVQTGCWDGCCCRHDAIMSCRPTEGTPTPGSRRGHKVHSVQMPAILTALAAPAVVSMTAAPELPEFTMGRSSRQWSLAPVPPIATVWVVGLYLFGVVAGCAAAATTGRWAAPSRSCGVGMGSFYVATASGLAAYDTTLLSVHMVQHMMLSMLVPLALALGAPVTLALRTLPRRPRALAAGGAALARGPGAVVRRRSPSCSTSSRRGRCTSPTGTAPRWSRCSCTR